MPPLTEADIINRLKNEKFCFFFGAGISRGVGLPLGNELGSMILEALGLTSIEAEYLSKRYHLERMLFLMKSYLGDSIHGAYSALSTRSYGLNHKIIAALHDQRSIPLLTTNQDILIEEALGNTTISSTFVKIHGTINDEQALRITLDRVSSLDKNIQKNLQQIAQNRLIIVIGYSFSDYDLKDFFESVKNQIYFLDYSGNGNDFLRDIMWQGDTVNYAKHRFVSSAESFLQELANELGIHFQASTFQNISGVSNAAIDRVKRWASQYPHYLRKMATSCLYQGLWEGTKTFDAMKNISNDTNVPELYRALAFAEASRASEGTASYKNQKKFLNKLKALKNLETQIRDFIYHINIAAYHHIHDNPISWWRALRHYSKSNNLFSQLQSSSVQQQFAGLINAYKKNIDHGISSSIEKLNRVKLAKRKLPQALRLISPYTSNNIACDLDFLCEALFIHAKLSIHAKNLNQAEKFYSKALGIAEWIRKDHSIDQALRGLAKINTLAGRYDLALTYLDESYQKAENTHEPILKARNLLTRAWVHKQKSEFEEAKRYKREGLDIYLQYRGRLSGLIDANFYLIAGR